MKTQLKEYINQKLNDLQKEKDMSEVVLQGKLSFGIDSKTHEHLPSWNAFIKNKKKFQTVFWSGCFILSFIVVAITTNVWDQFEQNWLKALVKLIVTSAMIGFFYVLWFYYSLFYQFRKTEREVRKLIYEDILQNLERMNQNLY